jgi:hypothetical protein
MTENGKLELTKRFCACGCDQEVEGINRHTRQPKRFRPGHNNRGKTGDHNHGWKGGITYDEGGYRLIKMPEHARANNQGYVREHILVMEKKIGRPLKPGEIVHHINRIKTDNRPENLELMTVSTHISFHNIGNQYSKKDMSDRKCAICRSIESKKWYANKNGGWRCHRCYMVAYHS